ncbi:Ig-like domain-containing protein [Martelella alba]|uniref:Big-1 domain-containing protein n=1 Tax=Martelella alba TaxID=2590451 RepID=A0ABY2SKP6_9HYPH|nr:Ig-like domain-containing protein [Martelella alba]TKI06149.1 hypothetical protein FCN80_11590 [Martelella alba]
MNLNPPILPQLINDSIPIDRVITDEGVIVEIPLYHNATQGDHIRIYWDDTEIQSFILNSSSDLPKLFIIPESLATVGGHSIYYSITDAVGNSSISPTVIFRIAIQPRNVDHTVDALVIVNEAHAVSGTNIILYTAYTPEGLIEPGVYLLFQTTGSAVLSASFGQTNANGQYQLSVTNPLAEQVLITATPAITPSVSTFTSLTFTQAPPDYKIDLEILSNNASANNIAQNIIRARLYDANSGVGVTGQILLISVAGQASYPSLVSTDSQGYAYIALTSTTVGTVAITVTLQTDTTVYAVTSVMFSVSYPVLMGTHTHYLWGNIGLQTFLGPYNIVVNHHYHIVPSRQPYQVKNCGAGYAFTVSNSTCSRSYGRYYTFLDTDLSDVIAIASGAGANLTSERYYYYPDSYAGEAQIQVWDYGPYYTTTLALPVTVNDGATEEGEIEADGLIDADNADDEVATSSDEEIKKE